MFAAVHKRVQKAGKAPGSATYTGDRTVPTTLTLTIYSPQTYTVKKNAAVEDCLIAPQDNEVIWINVEGLSNVESIKELTKHFEVHPLTLEDILNVEQRPKVEEFEEYIYITLKALLWDDSKKNFLTQQLSIVLGKNFIISFHELDTNLFDNIREKMQTPNQNLRKHGADYLMYRLIDSIIDEYFVVMEGLGEELEDLEQAIITNPSAINARHIYQLKRQNLLLRKSVWPMREAINHLLHTEESIITKYTLIYLRDVSDHTMQAIDTVDTFRDMLSSMLEMYLSSLTNRMNEIMKTLTIITTIFIPITALASIYGMNFEYMPGLHWFWSYPAMIIIMLMIGVVMMIYFRQKRWI